MLTYLLRSIFVFVFSITISLNAQGRWAAIEDAPIEVLFENQECTIDENGAEECSVALKFKILKEEGRSDAANYTLTYNEDSEEIKILEAKTALNGVEYPVIAKMIEDKALASSPQGFDQKRQVMISFPHAEVGAEIYLKYSYKCKKAILDKFYSSRVYFGGHYYHKNVIKLHSKLPLHIQVNDPKNVLNIEQHKDKTLHHLTITLTKPVYNRIVSEPTNSVVNPKHDTWVAISTLTDWHDFAKKLSEGYEKVLNQALPELLQNIADQAAKVENEVQQINMVTSLLNEKVQYMGDWRSVAGRYFPRDLNEVASSHVADCKDFSATTGAILRQLGYKVNAALVRRGEGTLQPDSKLPIQGNFNHAFLKVTGKTGRVYWLDPTNLLSMAQGMFSDVAEKKALVLDLNNPSYETTSNIDANHSQVAYNEKIKVLGNKVITSGDLEFKGEMAYPAQTAAFYQSEKVLKDNIFYYLSGEHLEEHNKKLLQLPELKSRIAQDIKIKFEYQQENGVVKTNLAPALQARISWFDDIAQTVPNQLSDQSIGPIRTVKRQKIIENIRVKDISKLNYQKDTPWISVKRVCRYKGKDTIINDEIVVKKTFISAEDLQTKEYQNLKKELVEHFKDSMIVLYPED